MRIEEANSSGDDTLKMASYRFCEIAAKYLGESGPLSLKPPSKQELLCSQSLKRTLAEMNVFEENGGMTQRLSALNHLRKLCDEWIYKKALEENIPAHNARNVRGKVFTFGSYQLGVNFRGSDIDALLVVPRFITREHFFTDFPKVLLNEKGVEDVLAVPAAFVPVMKMRVDGVEIDLLFAPVNLMTIRSDFSLSSANPEELFRKMDEKDIRSVNGVRVTEDILNHVYQKDVFRESLKAIRLWAKRRNVYSNVCGYLGGASWAILVAYICQLYPLAAPAMIVYAFFRIYKDWPWPKPVRIAKMEDLGPMCRGLQWDPKWRFNDRRDIFPIITPSCPCQNSSYNVQPSNKAIIEKELQRGFEMTKDIMLRQRAWSDLFEPADFFTYQHYLCVKVSGRRNERGFREHCGLVESKLRNLVRSLEGKGRGCLAHINPYAYGMGAKGGDSEAEFVKKWFIGIRFRDEDNVKVDLRGEARAFEGVLVERSTWCDADSGVVVTVSPVMKCNLADVLSPEEVALVLERGMLVSKKKKASPRAVKRPACNISTSPTSEINVPPSPRDLISSAINTATTTTTTGIKSLMSSASTLGVLEAAELGAWANNIEPPLAKRQKVVPSGDDKKGTLCVAA